MKTITIIALLFLSVITFSCSSDDDNETNSLIGTWIMTGFLSENAYDLNGDGTASNNVIVETGCYQNELIDINEDGTSFIISNSYLDIMLELVAGTTDEYEYNFNCVIASTDTLLLGWEQEGTSVLFYNENDLVAEATFLDDTLTFLLPGAYDVEVEENGVIVTITEDLTYVYTKQ